jgi:hypothetical protein
MAEDGLGAEQEGVAVVGLAQRLRQLHYSSTVPVEYRNNRWY